MLRDLTAALGHLVVFLTGSLVWMVALGVVVAVVFFVRDPSMLSDPSALDALDGLTMGLMSALQIMGLAGLAVGLALVLGDRQERPHRYWTLPGNVPGRLKAHLGLRRPRPLWPVVAFLGGLTVWTFPSLLAEWLIETFEVDSVSLELTTRMLLEGPLLDRMVMGFAVVVTAPLFEELIFRGYLWELAERATGRWGAFVLTTLLFAGYHLDPVHTVSLLPTAAFLGALRLVSDSLWPSVLAHFANNGIAIVVTVLTADIAADQSLPLALSVGGTSLTLVTFLAGLAWARSRPTPSPRGALS